MACFQPVCALLEEHVYDPIMAGRALHLGKIDQSISGSLMQKIQGAVILPRPADGNRSVGPNRADEDMPDANSTGEGDGDGSGQDDLPISTAVPTRSDYQTTLTTSTTPVMRRKR